MKKVITLLAAVFTVFIVFTGCGDEKSFEERLNDAVGETGASEPESNSQEYADDNAPQGNEEVQREPVTLNYAWGCNQCSKVLYQEEEPNIQNCPVGYTYNGGSGSTHNWKNYGEQGNDYYSCEFCGLNVQVSGSPNNGGQYCNAHEYGQALTSEHHWVK